jgi:hypothetical protein
MAISNLKRLNEVEIKKQNQVKISYMFAVFVTLDDDDEVDMNREYESLSHSETA